MPVPQLSLEVVTIITPQSAGETYHLKKNKLNFFLYSRLYLQKSLMLTSGLLVLFFPNILS